MKTKILSLMLATGLYSSIAHANLQCSGNPTRLDSPATLGITNMKVFGSLQPNQSIGVVFYGPNLKNKYQQNYAGQYQSGKLEAFNQIVFILTKNHKAVGKLWFSPEQVFPRNCTRAKCDSTGVDAINARVEFKSLEKTYACIQNQKNSLPAKKVLLTPLKE